MNREDMYKVIYNRVNHSIFMGVKYAEIYPDWDWVCGHPMKRMYALTWWGLSRKVERWLEAHRHDIVM